MKRTKVFFLGAVLACALVLQGCALSHSGASIRGRVIDAETKLPLAGVNVLAEWEFAYSLPIHGGGTQDIELLETVTNDEGWFELPSWGPKSTPSGVPMHAKLSGALTLFKSNYRWMVKALNKPGEKINSISTGRDSGNLIIEMERFSEPRDKYAIYTGLIISGLNYPECTFKKIPRMLIALDQEAKQLDAEGLKHFLPRLRRYNTPNANEAARCGSAEEFFKAYGK
jgi:hypothetical protein